MASTKFYFDKRYKSANGECPLKLAIFTSDKTAFINLGLKLTTDQWDPDEKKVVRHPKAKALNLMIGQRKQEIDVLIYEYTNGGRLDIPAQQLKQMVEQKDKPVVPEVSKNLFLPYFEKFLERYKTRTKDIYKATLKKLKAFIGEKDAKTLTFDDIRKEWLFRFDEWLMESTPGQNARNIHFRNIRAVFNDAIDEEVTHNYPFRKFKIKPVRTKKRSFKVETMRKIIGADLKGHEEKYRDLFMLIFCLCGINIVDLCHLKKVEDGRGEYDRAQTHRHYSIKVEPEAMALIEKCKGVNWLLSPLDTNKTYRGFYQNFSKGLKDVRNTLNEMKDDLPLEALTTYWARHTWATIAASIDIPKDTIAAALGHGGYTVTDIYIDFDQRKVDDANRKVLDYVFYGKDWRVPEVIEVPKKKRGRPRKDAA